MAQTICPPPPPPALISGSGCGSLARCLNENDTFWEIDACQREVLRCQREIDDQNRMIRAVRTNYDRDKIKCDNAERARNVAAPPTNRPGTKQPVVTEPPAPARRAEPRNPPARDQGPTYEECERVWAAPDMVDQRCDEKFLLGMPGERAAPARPAARASPEAAPARPAARASPGYCIFRGNSEGRDRGARIPRGQNPRYATSFGCTCLCSDTDGRCELDGRCYD
jgi:hypothetical protein